MCPLQATVKWQKTKLKAKTNVLEMSKRYKEKTSQKFINLALFSQSLSALRWSKRWEVMASFLLSGGEDIPAGGLGQCGNTELERGKLKWCKCIIINNLTTFSQFLLVLMWSKRWEASAGYYLAWGLRYLCWQIWQIPVTWKFVSGQMKMA